MKINVVALLVLPLFLFMVVSAHELSLPFNLPVNETFGLVTYSYKGECGMQGRCGWENGGIKCPKGVCCSYSGWCGTTSDYCDVDKCQSQCSGPFPQGRCGWKADNGSCPTGVCCSLKGRCGKQVGGRKCPTGVCCSDSGWCGTTSIYCDPNTCQSQCSGPFP
ncbi:hypothetical protein EJD97_015840 [Solanum chilense]|uniref:Chitin-binding type-1 domain-containing protein n=1 Tax=Solanum chilense TaxID=4083 RepID=A0A6N2BB63_SOLCI|nr:hypothetical protein EJD97_015840 [Solanum chilense]